MFITDGMRANDRDRILLDRARLRCVAAHRCRNRLRAHCRHPQPSNLACRRSGSSAPATNGEHHHGDRKRLSSRFISLIMPIDDTSLEIGLIGSEGMFGIPLALGVDVSPVRAVVQGAGSALCTSAVSLRRELARSRSLQREIGRYAFVRASQLAQMAGCTRFHVIKRGWPGGVTQHRWTLSAARGTALDAWLRRMAQRETTQGPIARVKERRWTGRITFAIGFGADANLTRGLILEAGRCLRGISSGCRKRTTRFDGC